MSVLFGEVPDVFKQVLEFYTKPGSWILDLTYGHGKLWSSINPERYRVTQNDVDPDSPAKHHVPFHKLKETLPGPYDIIVYDPPYLYGRSSHYLLTSEEKDEDWKPRKTKWTIDEQMASARTLNHVLPKILSPEGYIIVKIMNTRIQGKLIRNNQIICAIFSKFELKDEYIYLRTNVGFYRNPTTPQTAHGYYLVFQTVEHVGLKGENTISKTKRRQPCKAGSRNLAG